MASSELKKEQYHPQEKSAVKKNGNEMEIELLSILKMRWDSQGPKDPSSITR
jgi:hypothetical protein